MPLLPVAHELYGYIFQIKRDIILSYFLTFRLIYNIFYDIFGDLSFDVIPLYDFAITNAHNLLCFSAILLKQATGFTLLPFKFRSWSLPPVAKHGINLMSTTAFGDNYNVELKEVLWEHVVNTDHLQKSRQRKQNSINTNNEKKKKNKITLEYGISFDGHMVSVLFSAETIEMLPEANDDEQLALRSVDISSGKRGQHDRRVMFAYGDASLPSSMRSFTPTPSKLYKTLTSI
ncbi:hypothetical protein AB4K20DRAFT_1863608 [Rhizopus microsporus]